jgi:acylphosphatase
MKRVRAHISGMVQGVGYRYFVQQKAQELGVVGWVKNKKDGSVETVLQGEDAAVDSLIDLCKEGPSLSNITNFELKDEDAEEEIFDDFEVK